MTDFVAPHIWYYQKLVKFGEAAGFDDKINSAVIRRLGANALNVPEVTIADRNLLMGHNFMSNVYERYYLSKISKVGTQGLVAGRPEDRQKLEALKKLPQASARNIHAVSPAGRKTCLEDTQYLRFISERKLLQDQFKTENPNVIREILNT